MKFPTISVITPTLNSQRTLKECLFSIRKQSYSGKIEIIVADGGSRDRTLQIARKFGARIIKNKLQTGEAGKAVGAKKASGEIIAFIDSDNILPDEDWMTHMARPFIQNKLVIATEPAYFSYRKKDHFLTRYFALIGMGDPLNLFIGNYDRFSFITGKWTGMAIDQKEFQDKIEVTLRKRRIPTIGANGFLIRKTELMKYSFGDYLFDIDVLKFLAKERTVKIIKLKVGIVHLFSGDIDTFTRKQRRRIRDFLHFRRVGLRGEQTERGVLIWGIVKFIISTLTILPLIVQTLIGFIRKPDLAWFFHPIACWLTLLVYGSETVRAVFHIEPLDRKDWKQ